MSTATETQVGTLTADDVKAIQKAEQVVLRHYQGATTLETSLNRYLAGDPCIYTKSEQRLFPEPGTLTRERGRIIPVRGAISSYEDDSASRCDPEVARGFWMTSSAQYHEVWRTIASLMKPGADVLVSFVGNAHSNDNTKAAGLHADVVRIGLTYKGAQRPLVFEIDTSIGRNDTGRMVKPRG